MAKVSKNLRRLRKAQGKTQEQLAEALHVTRQAISNWENDKTQPDIDALMRLAEIFEVEIEELIYGEKRNVGTEAEPERTNAKLRIVLGVVGSVFVGIGLVLIFLTFWRDFPLPVQAVFSVIPMLGGQAFAVYVFLRRRSDVLWRECAAVLWCIGMISTVALINSVFDIHCGFQNCLLIDILICLPVFYLLNAVSPIIFYFYMVTHWSVLSGNLWASALLLLFGLAFPLVFRQNREDVRYKYTVWAAALGGICFTATQYTLFLADNSVYSYIFFIVPFLTLYMAGAKDNDYTLPHKPLGVLGCAGVLTALSLFVWMNSPSVSEWNVQLLSFSNGRAFYISCIASILLLCIGFGAGFRSFSENLAKGLLCGFGAGALLFYTLAKLLSLHGLLWGCCICATLFGAALIYTGMVNLKLMPVNLGLVMVFAQILFILNSCDISTLVLGILFLLFGAALIAVNYEMHVRKREDTLIAAAKREKEEES